MVDPHEIRSPCGNNVHLDLPRPAFQLGDRVMCISTDSDIPFGMRGTVVSLILPDKPGEFDTVDILFDLKFIRGSNLGGRCSDLRGAEDVPLHFLLNLSAPPNSERAQIIQVPKEKTEKREGKSLNDSKERGERKEQREKKEPRERKEPREQRERKPREKTDQVCRYWLQHGTCSFGNACRFLHTQSLNTSGNDSSSSSSEANAK